MKTDRRIQRTKQLLRDALMKLILERGYDTITIQEITDRANLGRATFYLHYRDKEDLLLSSLKETVDDLIAKLDQVAGIDFLSKDTSGSLVAFQHAGEHRNLYRVLLSGQATGGVASQLTGYIAESVKKRIQAQFPVDLLPLPLDILAQNNAGSLMALITWWVQHDTPYSAEFMARAYFTMNTLPLISALERKP